MKRIILSSMLVACISTLAVAETSVWKVEKGKSVMYLGGTCHLMRQSDFPLPPEFDKAYKAAEVIVFETDIGKLQTPATQQKLIAKAMYADGSTIDKHLSPEAFSTLSKYCASKGLPIVALKQFKPSIVVVTLTAMELMKLGVTQEGVDLFLYKLATKDKKTIKGLETVDQQIDFIVGLGKEDEDAFITHSLGELKSIKEDFEDLIAAWRKGDVKHLEELMVTELKTKTPATYKELITDRNETWLPLIDAYHKTPEKEFILVGAGHLVGPDGIIAALKKKGYKIEQL